MAKKFSERVARMSPESRARSDALYRPLLAEMPLQELRKALELTQQQVAASLGINQVAISKMGNCCACNSCVEMLNRLF